jgi:hypothetical protein
MLQGLDACRRRAHFAAWRALPSDGQSLAAARGEIPA